MSDRAEMLFAVVTQFREAKVETITTIDDLLNCVQTMLHGLLYKVQPSILDTVRMSIEAISAKLSDTYEQAQGTHRTCHSILDELEDDKQSMRITTENYDLGVAGFTDLKENAAALALWVEEKREVVPRYYSVMEHVQDRMEKGCR